MAAAASHASPTDSHSTTEGESLRRPRQITQDRVHRIGGYPRAAPTVPEVAGIVELVRRQTLDGGVRVDRDASFCDVPPDSLEVGIAFARAPIDEIRLPVGVDISGIETRIVIPV